MNATIKKLAMLLLVALAVNSKAGPLYIDDFQAYPAANPAPNPLTNAPAGGQWWYLDPTPTSLGQNEHRIYDSGTGGGALQSRVWISNADNAAITNAISISTLPEGAGPFTFKLSFLAATDTTTAGRDATFYYEVASSAGTLAFVSGANKDFSQTLTALSGYGIAPMGSAGKADNRQFEINFTGASLTTADRIFVTLRRVTNSGAAGAFIAFDDVRLDVETPAPVATLQPQSGTVTAGQSVSFSAAFKNLPEAYQWYKDGEPIAGATSTNLTIAFVTKPDAGSYVLWATNSAGAASTQPAILSVTDTTPPAIASAAALLTLEHIRVRFSEPVQEESATNAVNYIVSEVIAVKGARMVDRFTVELFTGALAANTSYTVSATVVSDLAGLPLAAGASATFTSPNLVSSPVVYNAGTSGTPPDPASVAGGSWVLTANTNVGMLATGTANENGSGLNAWTMSDQNATSSGGVIDYKLVVDAPSDAFAFTNGWRLLAHARMASDFGGAASPVLVYSHPGISRRFGVVFDLNAEGALTASVLGGATYVLPVDPAAYHTHVIAYDPATATATYYVDGILVVENYPGQVSTSYNGVIWGTGSSTGTGEMHFNRVQLDVVNATKPAVLASPASSVNGVGQKVTFTASFSPFVSAYQWYSNDVPIIGAVNTNYTTDFITLAMNGTKYFLRAFSGLGNVDTLPATLEVTSDTTPPAVAEAQPSLLLERVTLRYTEMVQPQTATNIANYTWATAGLTNVSAAMLDAFTVELRTAPQQPGSNYVLRVSNVRDTSSLAIAANTSVPFTTPTPTLFARYEAGNSVTRPAGPPDPLSADGGEWQLILGTDPNVATNAVIDDWGMGINAWGIRDMTTGASQFAEYGKPFDTNLNQQLIASPWLLTVRSRFVDDYFSPDSTIFTQWGGNAGKRYLIWYDRTDGLDLIVKLHGSNGPTSYVVTSAQAGVNDYHLHQVLYNPATASASYYFDGQFVATWQGDGSAFTYPGIQWGAGSSANMGEVNFNLVEFKAVLPAARPVLSLARSAVNVDVSFTGILESSPTGLGSWAPVATNTLAAPALYSAPAAGSMQFFRARSME